MVLAEATDAGELRPQAEALTLLGERGDRTSAPTRSRSRRSPTRSDRWREIGDDAGGADVLRELGVSHLFRGDLVQAERFVSEALASYRSSGRERGGAWALQNLAWISFIERRDLTGRGTAPAVGRRVRRARRLGRAQLGLRTARVRPLQPGAPRRGCRARRAHRDRRPRDRQPLGGRDDGRAARERPAVERPAWRRAWRTAATRSRCSRRSTTVGARSWRRARSCARSPSSAATREYADTLAHYRDDLARHARRRHALVPRGSRGVGRPPPGPARRRAGDPRDARDRPRRRQRPARIRRRPRRARVSRSCSSARSTTRSTSWSAGTPPPTKTAR